MQNVSGIGMMKSEYCVFDYGYRDAANYKVGKSTLLLGSFQGDYIATIRSKLESEELFIPEQVGLVSIQGFFEEFSPVPNSDDHVWHEFLGLRAADSLDERRLSPSAMSVTELIDRFRGVTNWDEALSPIYPQLAEAWAGTAAVPRGTG